ncbi:hypothetical protein [Hydrogenothermus marinus]|uniref:Uncharacterized protein n=1 Tax=Hydrogenothermus marinus TaxID=133270 RepID=A0A3M0BRB6_9AQUI|nr:hypothetical protein [Hydrogenothermus marinus]RMA97045.1 hypothetical protein CLV39_0698 [Hydrogenothermus marinus]
MMNLKNEKKIKHKLELISMYFDVDEFIANDMFYLEDALNTRNLDLIKKVDGILQKFKNEIKEVGVYEFILNITRKHTQTFIKN